MGRGIDSFRWSVFVTISDVEIVLWCVSVRYQQELGLVQTARRSILTHWAEAEIRVRIPSLAPLFISIFFKLFFPEQFRTLAALKTPKEWPREIKSGSATIKIYRTVNRKAKGTYEEITGQCRSLHGSARNGV